MAEPGSDDRAAAATFSGRPAPATQGQRWLNPGVGGIGLASLLADVGHEVPSALLPSS